MNLRQGLLVLLLVAGGCHPLPVGSLDRLQPSSDKFGVGNAYLIRGWRDLYSKGIDQLAKELEQANVNAPVFRASQWHSLASAIAEQCSAGEQHEPLILIGFSYGADDVLRIAHALGPKGISVDLVITIDPVTPPPVPPNVKHCINYYQSNGIWDLFPWLRGIPLKAESSASHLRNQNLRTDRTDLLEPNTSHATIAANPRLHREIIRQILQACREHPTTLYTNPLARDNADR